MQRAVVVGLTLTSVCLVFALSGPSAQRIVSGDGGGSTPGPVAVSVANFPQVQPVAVDKTVNVTGNVAVTNLPAVQQVAGTVNVGNLPLDAAGRVMIAQPTAASNALVLHSTTAAYQGDLGGRTGATRKCQAEFPGSHFVHLGEITGAITSGRPIIWLVSETQSSWIDDLRDPSGINVNTCAQWHLTDNGSSTPLSGWLMPASGGRDIDTQPLSGDRCTQSYAILCGE